MLLLLIIPPFFLASRTKQRAKPAFPSAESSFYPQLVRRVRFDDIALVRVVDYSRSAQKQQSLSRNPFASLDGFSQARQGVFPQLVAPRPGRIHRANEHVFHVRHSSNHQSAFFFLPPLRASIPFSRRRRRHHHHRFCIDGVRLPSFACKLPTKRKDNEEDESILEFRNFYKP